MMVLNDGSLTQQEPIQVTAGATPLEMDIIAVHGEMLVLHAVPTLTFETHQLNIGNLFRFFKQDNVGNGATSIVTITTPDAEIDIHFRFEVIAEQEARIEFLENPTDITGGTANTPYNGNRNFADTTLVTLLDDPTVDDTGAITLNDVVIGAGSQERGEYDSLKRWILKRNEQYVLRVTNNTAQVNEISIVGLFFRIPPE